MFIFDSTPLASEARVQPKYTCILLYVGGCFGWPAAPVIICIICIIFLFIFFPPPSRDGKEEEASACVCVCVCVCSFGRRLARVLEAFDEMRGRKELYNKMQPLVVCAYVYLYFTGV